MAPLFNRYGALLTKSIFKIAGARLTPDIAGPLHVRSMYFINVLISSILILHPEDELVDFHYSNHKIIIHTHNSFHC